MPRNLHTTAWVRFDLTPVIKETFRQEQELLLAMTEEIVAWAEETAEWMQQNAPWTDRSGFARDTLQVSVSFTAGRWNINLFGEAPYQIHLESMQDGKYAIIGPAVELRFPELMERLRGVSAEKVHDFSTRRFRGHVKRRR